MAFALQQNITRQWDHHPAPGLPLRNIHATLQCVGATACCCPANHTCDRVKAVCQHSAGPATTFATADLGPLQAHTCTSSICALYNTCCAEQQRCCACSPCPTPQRVHSIVDCNTKLCLAVVAADACPAARTVKIQLRLLCCRSKPTVNRVSLRRTSIKRWDGLKDAGTTTRSPFTANTMVLVHILAQKP